MKFDIQTVYAIILSISAILLIVSVLKKRERFEYAPEEIGNAVLKEFLEETEAAWASQAQYPKLIADGYPIIGPGAIEDMNAAVVAKNRLEKETQKQMQTLGLPYPQVYTVNPAYNK